MEGKRRFFITAKIGIIRSQEHSNNCAGYGCFPAMRKKTGEFQRYDDVELVGFDTCGGADGGKSDKIVARAMRLKEKGAEVIHLGDCVVGACPNKEQVGLPVVERTHGKH